MEALGVGFSKFGGWFAVCGFVSLNRYIPLYANAV